MDASQATKDLKRFEKNLQPWDIFQWAQLRPHKNWWGTKCFDRIKKQKKCYFSYELEICWKNVVEAARNFEFLSQRCIYKMDFFYLLVLKRRELENLITPLVVLCPSLTSFEIQKLRKKLWYSKYFLTPIFFFNSKSIFLRPPLILQYIEIWECHFVEATIL